MNTIKRLRKERGLSQEELAAAVHVHQTAVSQWETGRHFPDMAQAIELANYFNVTTDYLLGLTDDPTPPDTKKEPATDEGDGLMAEVNELLKLYRAATPEMQAAALGMLEAAEKARVARDSSAKDK